MDIVSKWLIYILLDMLITELHNQYIFKNIYIFETRNIYLFDNDN